ncbi:trp operon repressor [Staphylococcus agnetis]|uniref:trp operon repressor n=1 Tax=Staphylococcus agnetis TaxID=985762 RepID=UPI0021CFC4B5|nr:trp operon repressor [Staphylococcus agnetis]UXU63323.1 trp operon repressor [Staphylococcus agnetis]
MNEMMNVKHIIKSLLESNVTSYQIEKETGVSRAKIGRLRNGKNKIDDLTLDTAEKLYNYQKGLEEMENTKTYVVNMHQQDKEVEIWTKENGDIFWYTIPPAYLKDTERLINLIKDEDLQSLFNGELVEDANEFEYTLGEVKSNLESYRK